MKSAKMGMKLLEKLDYVYYQGSLMFRELLDFLLYFRYNLVKS